MAYFDAYSSVGNVATCYHCGDEIEFRWIDGALRPIHINGGWCSGNSRSEPAFARSSFETFKSYLDPNARCPVCGASVFFYRSPYNGRVFFDDVGWPWPKHPCTDKYQGRDAQISRAVNSRFKFNFRSRDGQSLDVYLADQVIKRAVDLLIRLKKVNGNQHIIVVVTHAQLDQRGVKAEDIKEAPSLVLPRDRGPGGETQISFMCARLQSVVILDATVER